MAVSSLFTRSGSNLTPSLFLTSTSQHHPQPHSCCRRNQPGHPRIASSLLCCGSCSHRSRGLIRPCSISSHRLQPIFARWVVTLVPPPHWCMCLIWSLRFLIRGHAICLLHQHGPRHFLSEKILLLCWFRYASYQQLGFAHL